MSGAHDHPSLDAPSLARKGGFLEARDARAKIVATLVLVLAAVLAPREDANRLGAAGALVVFYATLGRARPWTVVARATVVLPFALVGAAFVPVTTPGRSLLDLPFGLHVTAEGVARALDLVARAFLSGIALATLSLATELADLVRGLDGLGLPRAVVLTTTFTVRYLGLLREEMARLQLARELKTFGFHPALQLRAMGHSAGTLFVRTFERAERVHAAMVARGFEGRFPALGVPRIGLLDGVLVGGALGGMLLVLLA